MRYKEGWGYGYFDTTNRIHYFKKRISIVSANPGYLSLCGRRITNVRFNNLPELRCAVCDRMQANRADNVILKAR